MASKQTAREQVEEAAERHGWKATGRQPAGIAQFIKGVVSSGGRIMTVRLSKNDRRVLVAHVNDEEISGRGALARVLEELAR